VGATTDTRARMITSAALLLREHGVAGTSIAKVLEHSNGPRGSVAHHFPGGRAELITEALTWAGALVTDALAKRRAAGASPEDMFAFICDVYRKQLTATGYAAGCPVGAAAQEAFDDPAIAPVIADIISSWTAALSEALVAAGRSQEEAEDLALLCVCSLEGAIMVSRVQKSTKAVDTVKAQVLDLL
jgi:TetR/AcrR family transcriptional repressor of lmrAB and yxaGH operons